MTKKPKKPKQPKQPKQPRWWDKTDEPPSYLKDYESSGRGIDLDDANAPLSLRSPWLWPEVEKYPEWFDALVEMDRTHDLQPFLALLRTGQPVPAPLWAHLDDYFSRHQTQLKRAQGPPQPPSYEDPASSTEWAGQPSKRRKALLAKAKARVLELKKTMKVDQAIDVTATELGMPQSTLEAIYKGKHGGERRAKVKKRPTSKD